MQAREFASPPRPQARTRPNGTKWNSLKRNGHIPRPFLSALRQLQIRPPRMPPRQRPLRLAMANEINLGQHRVILATIDLCSKTKEPRAKRGPVKMGAVGFEPTKAEPSDLQSDPFVHFGTRPTVLRRVG